MGELSLVHTPVCLWKETLCHFKAFSGLGTDADQTHGSSSTAAINSKV